MFAFKVVDLQSVYKLQTAIVVIKAIERRVLVQHCIRLCD